MTSESVTLLHRDVTDKVIGVFYDTYNELGYGFPEYACRAALAIALAGAGVSVVQEAQLPVMFRGYQIARFRADLLVDDVVIVEVKATLRIEAWQLVQLRNYLKASGKSVGLLLNFGAEPAFRRTVFEAARRRPSYGPPDLTKSDAAHET